MLLLADNLHIMNPSVAKALQARDSLPLKRIAERCKEANAYAMDINLGPLRHHAAEIMTFVIETVQEIFRGKLVLDSVQPEVLAAGIEACKTPPIINVRNAKDWFVMIVNPSAFPNVQCVEVDLPLPNRDIEGT